VSDARGDNQNGHTANRSEELNLTALVAGVKADNPEAMEQLYGLCNKGVRSYFRRQFGSQDVDDKVHDSFVAVVDAVRRGNVREPEALHGYIRTIVRKKAAQYIENLMQSRRSVFLDEEIPNTKGMTFEVPDKHPDAEQNLMEKQEKALAMAILDGLPRNEREILRRKYVLEQTPKQIIEALGLQKQGESRKQEEHRLACLASRAKARFAERVKNSQERHNGKLKEDGHANEPGNGRSV